MQLLLADPARLDKYLTQALSRFALKPEAFVNLPLRQIPTIDKQSPEA